jgi:sterol desaturase/sphingolipid hydroxylase (fatty acid hydroxylase superfamily)
MPSARESWFLLLSIPFYTFLIGAEIFFSNWKQKKYYSVKDTVQNVYLTILNASLDGLLRWLFYISVMAWTYQYHFLSFANDYLYWFMLFILVDLAFYFEHRIDHYCRLFWAVHVTHHSSEEFNLSTGFRSSVFQPVYRFIYLAPIALLGFTPLDIVFMYSATQTYGILVHTQFINKMPAWFEAVFVSPSHHRVHHASNVIYLDKNMGMCLIIWDKMFGSFQKEIEEEPVKYGLTKPVEHAANPLKIIFHEWQAIVRDVKKKTSLGTRLKYIFMPPGWSPDGSTKTARQMRMELKQDQSTGYTEEEIKPGLAAMAE